MSSIVTKLDKHSTRLRNSTFPITIQCPKCRKQARNPKYVKYYKNLSGLSWHVSHDHKGEPWTGEFNRLVKQLAKFLVEIRP